MLGICFELLGYFYSFLYGLGQLAFVRLGSVFDGTGVLVSAGNPFSDYVFVIRGLEDGWLQDVVLWILNKIAWLPEYFDYPVWVGIFGLWVSVSILVALFSLVKNLIP